MLFEITSANISETSGYIGALFDDLKPLIYLIGGVLIGIFILETLVGIVRDRLLEREEAKEIEKEKFEYIGKRIKKRWEKRRAEVKIPEVEEA